MRYRVALSIVFAAFLLTAAGITGAATSNCTNAAVTAGLCRVNTNKLVSYDLAPADAADLVAAIATTRGCAEVTATTCSTPCSPMLVRAGSCTSGQLGTPVTVTKALFADATLRADLVAYVRQYREQLAVEPVRATARAAADPDIGN